jgi:hypothetical protein
LGFDFSFSQKNLPIRKHSPNAIRGGASRQCRAGDTMDIMTHAKSVVL